MRIQHNIPSMNAYRNYNNNAGALNRNLEKLSSGYRINRAGDDAAGLAISEKMRAQITGLDAATKNVKDGISLVKTAEGAMQEVHDMLGRMKYLATQSSNGTYQDDVDRENIQKEVNSLLDEINRIADSANFNGQKLLNGELDSAHQISEFAGLPNVGNALGTDTRLHADKTEATVGTSFTVDFGNVKVGKRANSTDDAASMSLSLGNGIGVTITASGTATWTKEDADLAKLVNDALAKVTSGTSYSSNGLSVSVTGMTYNTQGTNGATGWHAGTSASAGKEITISQTGNRLTFKQTNPPKSSTTELEGDATVSLGAGSGAFTVGTNMTYNNKTVDVTNSKAGKAEELASTHLKLTKEMMKVGSGIKIGNNLYTFVEKDATGDEIEIGDLLKQNKDGKIKDDEFVTKVTERLSAKAATNSTWAVSTSVNNGAVTKPGEIMLTEKQGQTDFDFKTINGVKDSLGTAVSGKGLNLQIGDTSDAYNKMKVGVKDMHAKSLGIAGLDVSTADAANASIDKIKKAIDTVSSTRGDLGAIQNRLEHTGNNLSVMKENIQDAEATIRDTDVADEMMSYTKNNILLQSAQAMLAQANQLPQGVLQLLQ